MPGTPHLKLEDGARVAVIGGGPAGSFFSYFLLQMAERVGRKVQVDLYEPRDYACPGPKGCNMCGGIVSESLMQNLAAEGIQLPQTVIQRRIDSYFLHMDVGSVRIETPLHEMRIASVARGAGPLGLPQAQHSFDAFLLELATNLGAERIRERVSAVSMQEERPQLRTTGGDEVDYDLLVGAVGVNSPLLKSFDNLGEYRQPQRVKAYVAEFMLGKVMIERYMANSMHVFLLDLPHLDFAALIPKSDFVTVCLLGDKIDKNLVDAFLQSKEVREVLPPHWKLPESFCHCSPHLNSESAVQPYGDRMVFVGDCGTTRLFKDGIGAAYKTAKAAAKTAIFRGISGDDFRRGFLPSCRRIHADNRLGKMVFAVTRQIQKNRYARKGLWRMTSREQKLEGDKRRMSRVLWDTFTGSAPYKSVFLRGMNPAFWGRFAWELAGGLGSGDRMKPRKRVPFASGVTALQANRYKKGAAIFHQGDSSDGMFVIQSGEIELVHEHEGRRVQLEVLSGGDFFGEMALFHEKTRPMGSRALEEAFVFSLERDGLLQRIHEDPPMAYRMIEKMAQRIDGLERALIRGGESGLTEEERERLRMPGEGKGPVALATGMGKKYQPREVIYHQGDRGDCMFVVDGGSVEVVRREGEQEICLGILGDGDFFGEMALFEEEVRPVTVRALEEVFIFTLERNALLCRIHEDPSMAFQLIENLTQRIKLLERARLRRGTFESSRAD
ncbi:MAG: cyclic nucleotide-binding domain-containing protein [Planctomycetota bacterium]